LSAEGARDADADTEAPPPKPDSGTSAATDNDTDTEWENGPLTADASSIADTLDASLENVFPDEPGRRDPGPQTSLPSSRQSSDAEPIQLEDIAAKPVTLRDHVTDQIASLGFSIRERALAGEIADTLDERGYVELDLPTMAERLNCAVDELEAVLAKLQTMEPAGLFARDLSECLSLQLARKDRLDPAMAAVVGRLDLLANRDFKALKRLTGQSEDDLFDCLNEIRSLVPHPGRGFDDVQTVNIVHDVTIRTADDGGWHIELNPDALPRVLFDREYHTHISGKAMSRDERDFVQQCYQDATWLERSLDQRANTILKVATEIVKRQDGFFTKGIAHLRPMTMKVIADAIDMHESTVSRVSANKFMLTPMGMFEFRFFFSGGIAAADNDGEQHAAESVRQRIRQLIDAERAERVLSDDAIVDALHGEGIEIARRTVAKYREGMHIPSSVQRRREKRAALKRSA
ncbi:MAG: RNA polymerase factor sigma-54, partial [Pseudomonadota bacterium]